MKPKNYNRQSLNGETESSGEDKRFDGGTSVAGVSTRKTQRCLAKMKTKKELANEKRKSTELRVQAGKRRE